MFDRISTIAILTAAARFPVVAILGARQVGKTTIARRAFPSFTYRDLEDPRTAERFRADPRFALDEVGSNGLILDEAQAIPELFAALRGAVDDQRSRNGRFILLGSAQPTLVRAVAESLAGRVATIEIDPLTAGEAITGDAPQDWQSLWLKGGFPDALRGDFRQWWAAYLRMLFERDLPQYGVRADSLFLHRFLTMLAHQHGGLVNTSALGGSLGVSHHTVARYLDVFEAVFLIRRLAPYFRNVGKRLIKAPKVYLRDSGLLHHLLNISSHDELASHPSRGMSWEGFVLEDVLRRERVARPEAQPYFWRTAAGAEIDLVIDRGATRIAVEFKAGHGANARAIRALRDAMPDCRAARGWIVDQAAGIDRLGVDIARAGFAEVIDGTP
jgi:uncharacterized protein